MYFVEYLYEQLYEFISGLTIVDTHEHLPGREEDRPTETDVLGEYLTHYFSCDLISAGLSKIDLERCRDASLPLAGRWRLVEPYWNAARHTGYGRSLDIAARELYGIEGISAATIEELNGRFVAARKPGHYQKALKEKARIRTSLLDGFQPDKPCDRRYFTPVFRLDLYRGMFANGIASAYEKLNGVSPSGFDDWLEATEKTIDAALAAGCAALKIGDAYNRPLYYADTPRADAEAEYRRFRSGGKPDAFAFSENFQNFMTRFVLRLADERGMVVQIHTGLQEGNGNLLRNADPLLLNNLFLAYPNVVFDIFHMGYPFEHTLSALAKNFANVHIDMCWAHIISPSASVSALYEWLDSVPANKISAFGGDYCFVDGVVGHSIIARQNVSRALAMKVRDGAFDIEQAKDIAQMLLIRNPERIFKLVD